MVLWQLRCLIRRENEDIQRKLARLHALLDPMMSLPPHKPPHV